MFNHTFTTFSNTSNSTDNHHQDLISNENFLSALMVLAAIGACSICLLLCKIIECLSKQLKQNKKEVVNPRPTLNPILQIQSPDSFTYELQETSYSELKELEELPKKHVTWAQQ